MRLNGRVDRIKHITTRPRPRPLLHRGVDRVEDVISLGAGDLSALAGRAAGWPCDAAPLRDTGVRLEGGTADYGYTRYGSTYYGHAYYGDANYGGNQRATLTRAMDASRSRAVLLGPHLLSRATPTHQATVTY